MDEFIPVELPRNDQAEAAIISTCLAHPKQYGKIKDALRPEDFYRETHRWAWKAIGDLHADGLTANAVSMADRLERAGKLDQFVYNGASGHAAIAAMITSDAANARDLDTLVAIVKNLAGKRALYYVLQTHIEPTLNGKPAREIISSIQNELGVIELATGGASSEILDSAQAVTAAIEATTKKAEGALAPIKTGLVDLDKWIGGWHPGNYITIAGRPGEGKTSFMLSTALHAALEEKKRVGIFSLEMETGELFNRMISQLSNIPGEAIRDGNMSDDQWPIYYQAAAQIEAAKIHTCESPSLDIPRLRTFARKMSYLGLDLLIVDYLQLVTPEKAENRVQEVSAMSRAFKLLARELKVPVLVAAQLNRLVEGRAEKEPMLSDLRESGSIEQDSDIVIFTYHKNQADRAKASLKIGKHRNGALAIVDVFFNQTTTRFCNAARPAANAQRV